MSVDATKPTDKSAISTWAALIRDIAAVANAAEAAAGGDLSRTITAESLTQVLVAGDMNGVMLCSNAGAITKTLPAADAGMVGNWIRFQKFGTGNLTITPDGTDAIADFGAGTSVANTAAAEAKVGFIELECVGVGSWVVAGMLGTWS